MTSLDPRERPVRGRCDKRRELVSRDTREIRVGTRHGRKAIGIDFILRETCAAGTNALRALGSTRGACEKRRTLMLAMF